MGEIPDNIRTEARKAIWDTGRGMIGRERNYLEDRVCRALLDAEKRGEERERERAAKVAETEGVGPETNVYGGGAEWYRHARRIAAAIRSGT